MKRRDFFINIIGASGAALAAPALISIITGNRALAEESRRKKSGDTGSDMLDPNDGTAKAVGYVEVAKQSSKSAGNKCSNCILFAKTEKINNKEVGTCTIFQKKYVTAAGYCNSWAKKA